MSNEFWTAAVLATLALGVALMLSGCARIEGFDNDATWEVYAAYEEVLGRGPDEAELREAARREETPQALRARLRATDEYTRSVRLQDASPTAAIALHARDRDVIARARKVYRAARGTDAPRDMDYVLRDLYLELQSWEAVATVLVSDWYPRFEEEALREIPDGLDRAKMMELLGAIQRDAALTEAGREALTAEEDGDGEGDEESGKETPDDRSQGQVVRVEELEALVAATVQKTLMEQRSPGGGPSPKPYPSRWDRTVSRIADPARDLKLRPEYEWDLPRVDPPACQYLEDPDTGLGASPIA